MSDFKGNEKNVSTSLTSRKDAFFRRTLTDAAIQLDDDEGVPASGIKITRTIHENDRTLSAGLGAPASGTIIADDDQTLSFSELPAKNGPTSLTSREDDLYRMALTDADLHLDDDEGPLALVTTIADMIDDADSDATTSLIDVHSPLIFDLDFSSATVFEDESSLKTDIYLMKERKKKAVPGLDCASSVTIPSFEEIDQYDDSIY